MKNVIAKVKNLKRLSVAYESLMFQDARVPERMGLVFGATGAGKTTAVAWLINQCNGVFVRANAAWTPNGMLAMILAELGAVPPHRNLQALNLIIERLAMAQRPLFVDEANYLFIAKS